MRALYRGRWYDWPNEPPPAWWLLPLIRAVGVGWLLTGFVMAIGRVGWV